ncbi:hypothetical protein B0J11DRAFT_425282 [Dendryphion nanum]|uniref:Uncharacterized protein n=1 Tax=Dendryphion nanum TaxID=256645 RepID=A0A9P9IY66_9PLEO|nr:hypothetical protein B0J11DRAFT_425282 [Dendryphion nanum]
MRHPAAPTIIAILIGFLIAVTAWNYFKADGHHEGNPHPDDVPPWKPEEEVETEDDTIVADQNTY